MFKTQPISNLLKPQPAESYRARELARNFEACQSLLLWLRQNWDGETFVLPMPPNMLNTSFKTAHWSVKRDLHEQYKSFLIAMRATRLMPSPPRQPPPLARISMHLVIKQKMDVSGAMAREKWPVDWLVTAGYLTDDNEEHLQWAGLPTQAIVPRGEPQRIEFRLCEVTS